jgi:hypothetical protein
MTDFSKCFKDVPFERALAQLNLTRWANEPEVSLSQDEKPSAPFGNEIQPQMC